MKMTTKQIKALLDAGVDEDTIDKLIELDLGVREPEQHNEPNPVPIPAPAPAPAPAPDPVQQPQQFSYDLLGQALGKSISDQMKPVIEQLQAAALGRTQQPQVETPQQAADRVIGEIINPPRREVK